MSRILIGIMTKASAGIKEIIPTMICPSEQAAPISDTYLPIIAATSSYAFSNGSKGPGDPREDVRYFNNGMFVYVVSRQAKQLADGLSNTFMLGEVVLADTWESSNTWSYTRAPRIPCATPQIRSTPGPVRVKWKNAATERLEVSTRVGQTSLLPTDTCNSSPTTLS